MKISPLDIQQQQFKGKMFGGLDPEEVDSFLQQVSQELELLIRDNSDLREQNSKMSLEIDEMNLREKALRETMLAAQRITEEMKSHAQKEATLIISDAELRAEKLLAAADVRLAELRSEIQELHRQKAQFEASYKSLLDHYSKMLLLSEE